MDQNQFMMDQFGSKICKYCGTYYSPKGTWHKENNNWVCEECWEKYFNITNGSTHWSREESQKAKQKKKSLIRKIFSKE